MSKGVYAETHMGIADHREYFLILFSYLYESRSISIFTKNPNEFIVDYQIYRNTKTITDN